MKLSNGLLESLPLLLLLLEFAGFAFEFKLLVLLLILAVILGTMAGEGKRLDTAFPPTVMVDAVEAALTGAEVVTGNVLITGLEVGMVIVCADTGAGP